MGEILGVVSLVVSCVSLALMLSRGKRKDAIDAQMEQFEASFKAWMLRNEEKLKGSGDLIAKLTNTDQRLESMSATLTDCQAALEGGLDDRIDNRLGPVVAKLNNLSMLAGLRPMKGPRSPDAAPGEG